jgi:uncharacterized iron-regulated membrane protein
MATTAPARPVSVPEAARVGRAPSPRASVGRRVWRRVRPVLFWTHLAVGIATGAVVLIMAFTGVLLTYQRQMTEWSAGSQAGARPTTDAARLPLDTLLARARAAAPEGSRPTALTVRADPDAPVSVGVGTRHNVYVNAYTGAVAEASPRLRKFFVDAERWHRSLATGESLRDKVGVTVTGACNLAFLFLVLSGLFLWWPRQWTWRAFRAVLLFQRRANGRQRDWNWHHVLGIWSAPALAAVVFSGVFISYQWPQRLVQRITGSPVPAEAERGGGGGGAARGGEGRGAGRAEGGAERRAGGEGAADARPPVAGAPLDTLWTRAAREVPGWYSVQLRLPRPDDARVTATVSRTSAMRPDQRVTITLDAASGAIHEQQRYENFDSARKFRSWMRGLHTGEVAGVAGQTIAGLVSAAAVVLAYTGFALTFRRLRSSLARRGRSAAAA